MCKNFFHATCAQREGLLCSQQSEEVDPFFAYCKMHSDKQAAKLKRRNYLALMAKNRLLSREHQPNGSIEDSITSQRTLSKLTSQRQKFIRNFQQLGNQSGMLSVFVCIFVNAVNFNCVFFIMITQLERRDSPRCSTLHPASYVV